MTARVMAAVVAVLFTLLASAVPAHAAGQSTRVSISPAAGPPGTEVTVTGHGFRYERCTARAQVAWEDTHQGKVLTLAEHDPDPSFTTTMTVPVDADAGQLTLLSWCGMGEFQTDGPPAYFTVEVPTSAAPTAVGPTASRTTAHTRPEVALSPATAAAGTAVLAHGTGFLSCASGVVLRWEGHTEAAATAPISEAGWFETAVEVPARSEPGQLTLVARCVGQEVVDPVFAGLTVEADTGLGRSTASPPTTDSRTTNASTISASKAETTWTSDPSSASVSTGADDRSEELRAAERDDTVHPVRLTNTMPTADMMDTSLVVLVAAGALALLLILLVAFPAELFNKTYETNKDEIHGLLTRIGLRNHRLPPWLGLTLFILLGAALSAMLASDEGASGNPVAQVIGFLVAIPVVAFAYGLPAELVIRRHTRLAGVLNILPMALLVMVLCTGLSKALSLEPPYLYGLFVGFLALRARTPSHTVDAAGVMLGALCLTACGMLAWLAWNEVHGVAHGAEPTWPAVVADAALFWIFVLGAESLVFALQPLRFLDGEKLRRCHLLVWLVPQVVAAVLFAYVLLLRGRLNPPEGGAAAVLKALAFFAIFGVLSVLFWSYFRWSGRPTRIVPVSKHPTGRQPLTR